MNNFKSICSNPTDDFSEMPMCIHKDHYINGNRTHLISINNNVVRPNRKLIVSSLEKEIKSENIFSLYHFHEGIEILRITKGNCTVVINETSYGAYENDILIANPFEAHGIYLTDISSEFERSCIIFKPSDLFPAKKKSNLPLYNMLSNAGFVNHISGKNPYTAELCRCIDEIIRSAELRFKGWQAAILGQLVTFYSVMIRENLQIEELSSIPYRLEFMTKVTDYVEENLSGEITTEKVAEYCLYSVEHFCRLFKRCFNRTFKEYLNICRIGRARDIIDNGRITAINEIGTAVGFNNANHFCNTFKKSVGMTPSEYINRKEKLV